MRISRAFATGAAAVTVLSSLVACNPTTPGALPVPTPSLLPATSTSKPVVPSTAPGSGFVYPAPGQRTGSGKLPPAGSVSDLGIQKVNSDIPLLRDLGFSGVVNGESLWTFGDTILDKVINDQGLKPMAYDAVALGLKKDEQKVEFKSLKGFGEPANWVPLTASEEADGGMGKYAMGGTNVVEYAPGKGLVYYLKNSRPGGTDHLLGAGVAQVTADSKGAKAVRTKPVHSANKNGDDDTLLWGPDDPYYGDIGITYDPRDKKVYSYGNGPEKSVYLARVPADKANDVDAYEYWDESKKSWYTGVKKVTSTQAIFTRGDAPVKHHEIFNQANAFWSNYYNKWMFLTSGDWVGTTIGVMTADKLEGPWSEYTRFPSGCSDPDHGTICYAVTGHPEYDESGKTILVSFTDWPKGKASTLQLRKLTLK